MGERLLDVARLAHIVHARAPFTCSFVILCECSTALHLTKGMKSVLRGFWRSFKHFLEYVYFCKCGFVARKRKLKYFDKDQK